MDRIDEARHAEDYDQLVTILQQMNAEDLRAVDNGSLPTWGEPQGSSQSEGSLLSWDTEGLEPREVRVVYSEAGARLTFRDGFMTSDAR